MIHYETLPSDALKVGLIKIPLEALVTKCSLVHYVPGTTISPTYSTILIFEFTLEKNRVKGTNLF